MPALHVDELPLDCDLVRRLVDRAFPEHAADDLVPMVATGSSNALYRLGHDRLVRLPRQPGGGASIEKEARWLPYVSPRVGVAVPRFLGVGEPDLGYGERWGVTTWIDGVVPAPPSSGSGSGQGTRSAFADDLARFVTELRAMEVPSEAAGDQALSSYRAAPITALDADFRHFASQCRGLDVGLDLDQALRVWDRAVESSDQTDPTPTWLHGDLVVENLLVDPAGRLAAVLDFGGLAVGDPTVDLIVAWEALDEEGRSRFRRVLDVDDATWAVSRGWALLVALMTLPYYGTTMPRRCADRLAMARAANDGV